MNCVLYTYKKKNNCWNTLMSLNSLDTGNGSLINTFFNSTLQNITCREDFRIINNTCQPRCDRFEQGTHDGNQLLIYSELIASCFALLLCILIVGISVKDYKTMQVHDHHM